MKNKFHPSFFIRVLYNSNMKIVIISGGSKGLGLALCQQYLANGYQAFEFSRSATHPFSVQCDFAQPETALAQMTATFAELSRTSYDEMISTGNIGLISPALLGDSAALNMQHMGVIRDFDIPY